MFVKLILFRETQTDESDVEPEPPEAPSRIEQDYQAARSQIQSLMEQLKITQLEVSKKEAEMRILKEAATATKESSEAKIQELETSLRISWFLNRWKKNNEVKYCSLHLRGNFTLNSVISISLFNINKTQDK